MRVAISGSHRTGKSALISELAALLPKYGTVEEPYHLLEEDGHEFSHPPSIEDFTSQLERSRTEIAEAGADVLFDRSPIDFLAYLALHEDAEGFDVSDWLPRVRDAVESLDLIIFVPVEAHERIALSAAEQHGFARRAVDEKLRELLLDDPLGLGVNVREVEGNLVTRTRAALRLIR